MMVKSTLNQALTMEKSRRKTTEMSKEKSKTVNTRPGFFNLSPLLGKLVLNNYSLSNFIFP